MKSVMFLLSVFALISGCATIIDGSDQQVTFNSNPDGAVVIVNGVKKGVTPLSVMLPRAENQTVRFEKEGFQSYETVMSTETNPMFWGNIIIGGLLGSTTDAASGAIYNYGPDQYFINLKSEEAKPELQQAASSQIRELFLDFGEDLRLQIASGEGDSLDALVKILNTDDESENVLNHLKQLAAENTDNLALVNEICEAYNLN